jgi:hypothetical protein
MGDIWFYGVIIIFAYFAQFVAHEQTRVTLVPLSGNAFNDNFSAEELKMVPAQSGRKELKMKGSGSGMNLRGEKRYQTCEYIYQLVLFGLRFIEIASFCV